MLPCWGYPRLATQKLRLAITVARLQAPILAARTPEEAALFASKLKDAFVKCHAVSRMAMTGSGMVTLLNTLRRVKVNGHMLWDMMTRVHLGATPVAADALSMAEAIVSHSSGIQKWSDDVKKYVTAERIVQQLTPQGAAPGVTSARQALVAFLVHLMGDAAVGLPDSVLQLAYKALVLKVQDESEADTAVALAHLDKKVREVLYRLAGGTLTDADLERELSWEKNFPSMLHTLCEPLPASPPPLPASPPPLPASPPLHLLPPYGALFLSILAPNGRMLIERSGSAWELTGTLRNAFKLLNEHSAEIRSDELLATQVSDAVMQSLAANGIGVDAGTGSTPAFRTPKSLAEAAIMPVTVEILRLLNNQQYAVDKNLSKSMKAFQKHLANPGSEEATNYFRQIGLHISLWLRHVEAHVYLPKSPLVEVGLRVAVVDAAVQAGVAVLVAAGKVLIDALGALRWHMRP